MDFDSYQLTEPSHVWYPLGAQMIEKIEITQRTGISNIYCNICAITNNVVEWQSLLGNKFLNLLLFVHDQVGIPLAKATCLENNTNEWVLKMGSKS